MSNRIILHCDLNNFFASVEMIKNPTLRGKAIAVCGDPTKRGGIVLAKSEPAKKCGVKTGMPIWQAKQLCPDIIIVTPTHMDYSRYSRIVRDVYYRYTDKVEAFGGDECWLDVTASLHLFAGDGKSMADEIRRVIREEIGLTVSVGVSWNKAYAKIGSDLKKPDATTVISRENYRSVVFPLPVTDMLYIGGKSAKLLEKLNIRTIGDLAAFDPKLLSDHVGINAYKMTEMARGDCTEEVKDYTYKREVKSVGNGTTMPRDIVTRRGIEQVVYLLGEEVAFRMRKKGVKGTTVTVSVRDAALEWTSAQTTIPKATNSVQTLCDTAMKVFDKLWKRSPATGGAIAPVHSLRIAVSNLTTDTRVQLSLFDNVSEEKNDKLSAVFDDIRRKYGVESVMFGTALGSQFKLHFEVLDD